MLFWTMKWVIMSIVLILVMHHLYIYFMETLTVPMNKDFINRPVEKYKEMLDTIRDMPKSNHPVSLDNIIPTGSSLPSGLPSTTNMETSSLNTTSSLDTTSMQNELQSFLNELKKSGDSNTMQIDNISSGTHL
jgi:hypothetical protein